MKKATKIIGAVLGVLLVAALFTGAAAAADNEYDLGDVYLWKLYEAPLGGVWTAADGSTAEMVLDDVTGEYYFSGNNTKEGTYTYSKDLVTYKITIKAPSATVYGLIYDDDDAAPINELIGNTVDTDKIISFKDVNAGGLVFTHPDGILTSTELVGAEIDPLDPVYQALVLEADIERAAAEADYDAAAEDYEDSAEANDLVQDIVAEDILSPKTFVLKVLEDLGYNSMNNLVYKAIVTDETGVEDLDEIKELADEAISSTVKDRMKKLDANLAFVMSITDADLQPTTAKAYVLSLPDVKACKPVSDAISALLDTAELTAIQAKAAETAEEIVGIDEAAGTAVAGAVLPLGYTGTPVDYLLSLSQVQACAEMKTVLSNLKAERPNATLDYCQDYVEDHFKSLAGTEATAATAAAAAVTATDFKTGTDKWTPVEFVDYFISGHGGRTTIVDAIDTLTTAASLKEVQAVALEAYLGHQYVQSIAANDCVQALDSTSVDVKGQVLALLISEELDDNHVYDAIEAVDLNTVDFVVATTPILLGAIKDAAAAGYAASSVAYLESADEYYEALSDYLVVVSQTYTDLSNVDLGIWTVQGYFEPSTAAYDEVDLENGYTGYASLAPKMMFGKEYYFNVIKQDSTTKLTASIDGPVTQGGYFTVTVTAPGYAWYDVEVDENGFIPAGQANVSGSGNEAEIYVGADGVGQFVVKSVTDDDIKVTLYKLDSSDVDKTLTIKVKAGEINVATTGASTYIGDEVKISGTNDLGGNLDLFIKGPNFNFTYLEEGDAVLTPAVGKEWEAKIDTAELAKEDGKKPDAGNYTIYIAKLTGEKDAEDMTVSDLDNKDYCYAYTTVVVALKQPFIQITEFPDVVVKGDKLVIKGTAEGQPKSVKWYIFGTNFFDSDNATVDDAGVFEITYPVPKSDDQMQANQYFVVIQHPMYDKEFSVGPGNWINPYDSNIYKTTSGSFEDVIGDDAYVIFDTNKRQSANAAQALCDALDDQNIDDMYVKQSFFVAGPSSVIGAIPEQIVKGEKLTISGVAIGHKNEAVSVELLSTAFAAVPKETVGSASFSSVTARIGADGLWTVTIDTSDLNADNYTVSVAVGQLDPATSKIKIVEGTVPKPTTQPTTQPTTAPTTVPTQTPKSPGFGILAALAGLGAVAVLLLRRQ